MNIVQELVNKLVRLRTTLTDFKPLWLRTRLSWNPIEFETVRPQTRSASSLLEEFEPALPWACSRSLNPVRVRTRPTSNRFEEFEPRSSSNPSGLIQTCSALNPIEEFKPRSNQFEILEPVRSQTCLRTGSKLNLSLNSFEVFEPVQSRTCVRTGLMCLNSFEVELVFEQVRSL